MIKVFEKKVFFIQRISTDHTNVEIFHDLVFSFGFILEINYYYFVQLFVDQ